jgi:four helix bundle protein
MDLLNDNNRVYQKAVEFLAIAYQLIESIPKGNGNIVDQLKRASVSAVLNIAEGAGHPSPPKEKYHFAIARGSALECGAVFDTCRVLKVGSPSLIPKGKDVLVSVVAMLSKMSRK